MQAKLSTVQMLPHSILVRPPYKVGTNTIPLIQKQEHLSDSNQQFGSGELKIPISNLC